MAKLPSKNPLAQRLRKAADGPEYRKAVPVEKSDVIGRANRSQAMEAKEMKMTKKPMKKYAKGGSVSGRADGVAKKGKTKAKMVKMAMGGMALSRGAAEMGGGPATMQMQRPAGYKKGGSCGMKKGK